MVTARPPGPLILVVDDVADNREVYCQIFAFKGYRVLNAADGPEGLGLATSAQPDLIVLDLGLPKLDGWEVARRLKGNPETGKIPVIALTGHAQDSSRARAIAAGVDRYLVKPCLPEDLLAAVRQLLGARAV